MTDTPDTPLYRQAWELNDHAPNAVYTLDHIGVYYEGYLTEVELCEHGTNVFGHWVNLDRGSWSQSPTWCPGSPILAGSND